MTIGERIKKRRKELNISVDRLADILGKNRATVYRYESDEIENLPISILEPLAKALHTTPAYLMGWLKEDDTGEELIDYFDDTLEKVISFIESNGYTVDYGKFGIVFIYNKNSVLISCIQEGELVRNYERMCIDNLILSIDELLKSNLSTKENILLSNFDKLNTIGQDEAVKRVEELTHIDTYKKDTKITSLPKKEETPGHLKVKAARPIPGVEVTDSHDDDIMNDPNF